MRRIHSEIHSIHFEYVFKGKGFSKFNNRNQLIQNNIGFLSQSCGQIGILKIEDIDIIIPFVMEKIESIATNCHWV